MFQLRIPSRPVRYAIVAAHTFREALEDISVDAKLDALIAKVSQLEEKLEALDDSIDETPKPKAKAKQRGKASSTAVRKPRAKKSG